MTKMLALLVALAAAACLRGQPATAWILPEGNQLLLVDSLGSWQVIGTFPASGRNAGADPTYLFANAECTSLEQRGKDLHLVCSNGDAIYYVHSSDSGAHWVTEEVDHMRHYQLMQYHPGTDNVIGPSKGLTYMAFGGAKLALDAKGLPHVAYTVSGGNYDIDCFAVYARRERGKWATEKVLTAQGYPRRYLGYISLDVDAQSVPHVLVHSHEQPNTSQHSLALYSKAGGKWHRQLVSSKNTNGVCMELAIDSRGGFHAVATAEDVAYYWFSSDRGTTWTEDSLMTGNCSFDLVLDSEGQPHIAGACYSKGIYYGEKADGKWQVQMLEARPQMCHAKVVMSPQGEPWVAFISHYYGDQDVVAYKRSGGKWLRETLFETKGNRGSSVKPLAAMVSRRPPVKEPGPLLVHEERPAAVQDTLEVTTQEVEISVSDYQKVDGDTISVSVNGSWVMEKVALTQEALTVRVKLQPGANSIVVYAWNEGLVPPNTAILRVRSGSVEKSSTLRCTLAQNAAVTLVLK